MLGMKVENISGEHLITCRLKNIDRQTLLAGPGPCPGLAHELQLPLGDGY